MPRYCRKCGLPNPKKDELVTIYEGQKFCDCDKNDTTKGEYNENSSKQ